MWKKLRCLVKRYHKDDYYIMPKLKRNICIMKSVGVVLFLAFFFYRSLWACIVIFPIGIIAYLYFGYQFIQKEKEVLEVQFKEFIISMAANLRAGYSSENAVIQCTRDMKLLFGDNSLIERELLWIKKGLQNNDTLEQLFFLFGEKSKIQEIKEFASVFSIAKRSGGNLTSIITDTTVILSDRLEMQRETKVLISGKKLEQNIMSIIPFFIVAYIEVFTPGYFGVLYDSLLGVVIMTVCLILYVFAYALGCKIIHIKF